MNQDLLSTYRSNRFLAHHSKISTSSTGKSTHGAFVDQTSDKDDRNTYLYGGNVGLLVLFLGTNKYWGDVIFKNSENGVKLGNEVWGYFEKVDKILKK